MPPILTNTIRVPTKRFQANPSSGISAFLKGFGDGPVNELQAAVQGFNQGSVNAQNLFLNESRIRQARQSETLNEQAIKQGALETERQIATQAEQIASTNAKNRLTTIDATQKANIASKIEGVVGQLETAGTDADAVARVLGNPDAQLIAADPLGAKILASSVRLADRSRANPQTLKELRDFDIALSSNKPVAQVLQEMQTEGLRQKLVQAQIQRQNALTSQARQVQGTGNLIAKLGLNNTIPTDSNGIPTVPFSVEREFAESDLDGNQRVETGNFVVRVGQGEDARTMVLKGSGKQRKSDLTRLQQLSQIAAQRQAGLDRLQQAGVQTQGQDQQQLQGEPLAQPSERQEQPSFPGVSSQRGEPNRLQSALGLQSRNINVGLDNQASLSEFSARTGVPANNPRTVEAFGKVASLVQDNSLSTADQNELFDVANDLAIARIESLSDVGRERLAASLGVGPDQLIDARGNAHSRLKGIQLQKLDGIVSDIMASARRVQSVNDNRRDVVGNLRRRAQQARSSNVDEVF